MDGNLGATSMARKESLAPCSLMATRRYFSSAAAAVLRSVAPDRTSILSVCGKEVFVREWGNVSSPVVLLWHGLGRTGSDIAPLASAMRPYFRVISPDLPGRGLSQWMDDISEYGPDALEAVAVEFVNRVVPSDQTVRWIGTSLGGILGIIAAGSVLRDRVSHLVLNDVGPEVPRIAIERIMAYSRQVRRWTLRRCPDASFV